MQLKSIIVTSNMATKDQIKLAECSKRMIPISIFDILCSQQLVMFCVACLRYTYIQQQQQ